MSHRCPRGGLWWQRFGASSVRRQTSTTGWPTYPLDGSDHVKTTTVETAERGRSPLGAYIRRLMDGTHGNMIHSTVPPGMVGRACHFRTIEEYWYVLSGEGEIWRSAGRP